jgi:alpha-tubulin suppressor-like RCC1 family protein/uncharacterized protein YjdB
MGALRVAAPSCSSRKSTSRRVAFAFLAVSIPAWLGSCGGGGVDGDCTTCPPPNPIAVIDVHEPAIALKGLGATKIVTVTAKGKRGETIDNPNITWQTSNASVATVAGSGASATITSVGAGSATITAKAGTVEGKTEVTVTAVVYRVVPEYPTLELYEEETRDMEARVEADPGVKDSVCWSSSSEVAARVTPHCTRSGERIQVKAGRHGAATLTGESVFDKQKTATVLVNVRMRRVDSVKVTLGAAVVEPNDTTRARVNVYDNERRELSLDGRSVSWTSSNTTIATVDNAGLVTGLTDGGNATISVTVDAVVGHAVLAVQRSRVQTVEVTLGRKSLFENEKTQATAVAKTVAGTILTGRNVTWSSSNIAVATVDAATGGVTAIAAGSTNITATIEGIQDSEPLTVSRVPVASVQVQLDSATINPAQTTMAKAIPRDTAGNALSGRKATWSSSNQTVATVNDTTGEVTGVAKGTASIRATVEGITGESSLQVELERVVTVTVGAPSKISVGKPGAASATPRNAAGNPLQLSGRTLTWESSNTNIATIDKNGKITALAAGKTDITATVDGIRGSKPLDVDDVGVTSVDVLGNPAVIAIGGKDTLTFVPKAANGTPLTGRQATWSSSDLSVATISDSGVVTALTSGSVDFTATVDGVAGKSTKTNVTIAGPVAQLVSFGHHACVRTPARNVYCWGSDSSGQLGQGTTGGYRTLPTRITSRQFDEIVGGHNHTCGRDNTTWYCWGDNVWGQLGDGTNGDRPTPTRLATTATFTQLVAGNSHTCGLTATGTAYCWGWNQYGQLGDGTFVSKQTPTQIVGFTFTQLRLLAYSTCGIEASGQAYCWGYNPSGQVGDGTNTNKSVPTAVNTSASGPFTTLIGGWYHTCGFTASNGPWCWGHNFHGELGNGDNTAKNTPVQSAVGRGPFSHFTASWDLTCGVTTSFRVYCWGYNHKGQIGNGTTTDTNVPVEIAQGLDIRQIKAGYKRSCGQTSTGLVYCWGANDEGQVGDGTTTDRLLPTVVK